MFAHYLSNLLRYRVKNAHSPHSLHTYSNVLPRPPTPASSTDKLRRLETPLAPSGERRTSSCDAEPHVHRLDPTIGNFAPGDSTGSLRLSRVRKSPPSSSAGELRIGGCKRHANAKVSRAGLVGRFLRTFIDGGVRGWVGD